MGKASTTNTEPPENDGILTTETTRITIAKERFDRVYLLEEGSALKGN